MDKTDVDEHGEEEWEEKQIKNTLRRKLKYANLTYSKHFQENDPSSS